MDKLVINCTTGESEEAAFTPEEIAQREYEASLPPAISEPTELELLQEDNAGLWYESMIQSTRVEANETEVASLWYELMMGGI